MTVRELFEQRAEKLKIEKPTTRQLFEQRAKKLEPSEKSKEIAKEKFFGLQVSPETVEKIREQVKGKFVTPAVEAVTGFGGIPGEIAEFAQRLLGKKEPIKTLPTGADLKRSVETLAGEKFEPKTPVEKKIARFAGTAGRLAGPGGIPKAIVGGLLSTGLEDLAEEVGAPEIVKQIFGTGGALLPFLFGRGGAKLPQRKTELRRIAERERIKAPAAAVAEKLPKRRLKIAKVTEKTAERAKAFEKSVESAKDRIIEGITPLAKNEAAAEIAKREGGAFLNKARKTAEGIKEGVSTKNLESVLDKSVKRLLQTPALSTEEKGTLKFLTEMQKGLKVKDPVSLRKFTAKNRLTNLTALNNSLNKEIKFLKPTTTGDKMLLDVKDALMKDIETVAPKYKQFFKEWKMGNKLFSQGKKFEQIRETLAPAFTQDGINFDKFRNIFIDVKKQKVLVKLLGKEQFNRLKDISKLGKASADAFKEVSKDPRIFRQLERLGNFAILGAFMGRSRGAVGIILAEKVGVRLLRGYMGRVVTNPKFSKNYLNFQKALKLGGPKGIVLAAKRVNDDIERTKKDIKN